MFSIVTPILPHRMGFLFVRYFVILLSLILIWIGHGHAEVKSSYYPVIRGVVLSADNEPLDGVHIVIEPTKVVTISDKNGKFELQLNSSTAKRIVISHIGCQKHVIVLPEPITDDLFYQVALKPLPEKLDPITVYSPYESTYPLSTETIILSANNWEKRNESSIADVLRTIPGVKVLESHNKTVVSLRGSATRHVTVKLDGIPLNDTGSGEADISSLSLSQFSSVQIAFKGLGGEINFITTPVPDLRKAIETKTYARYGSAGEQAGGVNIIAKHNNSLLDGQFSQKYDKGDFEYQLDNGTKERRINNYSHINNGKIGTQYVNHRLSVRLAFQQIYHQQGLPGAIYSAPTPEAKFSSIQNIYSFHSQYHESNQSAILALWLTDNVNRYINPAEQFNPITSEWVKFTPEDNRQSYSRDGIDFSWNYSKGLKPFLQYNFIQDNFLSEDLLRSRVIIGNRLGQVKRNTQIFSGGIKFDRYYRFWQYRIMPLMSWNEVTNPSARGFSVWTPALTAQVDRNGINSSYHFNLGWSRSVVPAPLSSQFLNDSPFAVGNRNLKPERGEIWNAGVSWNSSITKKTSLRAGITMFRRSVKDFIIWRQGSFGRYLPDNLARAKISGIELDMETSLLNGAILINFDYIYNNARNDNPDDINYGNYIPFVPLHSGSMGVVNKISNWRTALKSRWESRRYSTPANSDHFSTAGMGLDPYLLFDLSVNRVFNLKSTTVELTTEIFNINNVQYRLVERSPLPGRIYSVGLSIEIGY